MSLAAKAAMLIALAMLLALPRPGAAVSESAQDEIAEDAGGAEEQESPATQPAEDEASQETAGRVANIEEIPLDNTLRFIIQPTILGLVPPRGPAGFGEVFLRVRAVGEDSLLVHYEIKEEVPPPEDGSIEPEPGRQMISQIRRGEITVAGVEQSRAILPPLYWGNSDLQTQSSLVWLSRTAFAGLAEQGSCRLDLSDLGGADNGAAAELESAISGLAGDPGEGDDAADEGGETVLELEGEVLYPCVVNGKRARLPALHCTDALGLAEYWVLDDADNPLLLKLTYTLGDEQQREDLSFIRKGGGYAITSIDFTPRQDKPD